MAEAVDLTPRIIGAYDDVELRPGNDVREITRVRFMVGRFGPFEAVFPRGPQRHEIDAALQVKRASLEGLV